MIIRFLLAFFAIVSVAYAAVLRVDVIDLRNDHGVVYCQLFQNGDGFPSKPDKARARVKAQIKERSALCEFPDLTPGNYAVAGFHDEKGTGKLEKTFLGVPKERVAVSNDISGHWGRPNFNHSKVEIGSKDMRITLHIHYSR